MTTPTYKTLIEKKYNELIKDVGQIINIDSELLPVLDDEVNWVELIQYIEFIFPDDNTLFNTEELFEYKQISITKDQLIKLVPIIDKYLQFMKTIKKYITNK